ncbi:XRE family transcriptional regulator [Nocardia sp. NBC_01499]|uniref:XRE family transcriptional regulator n=1 Tax=Nocardia sp. NBC_01499 TaxID=2903597 RepID=UPI00386AF80F
MKRRGERAHRELAQTRAALVARLRSLLGPAVTADAATALLQQARAWAPGSARRLESYLSANPDAFTTSPTHHPACLDTLMRLLDAAGHGHLITLPACVTCGHQGRPLPLVTDAGRCCHQCHLRRTRHPCDRCGRVGNLVARRPEGRICSRCYRRDPATQRTCVQCGRRRPARQRRDDGTYLCEICGRPREECAGCGRVAPVLARTMNGPLCSRCHDSPPRRCGICGNIASIHARATADRPDTCTKCYRNIGRCVVCGHQRNGGRYRGGEFHCATCWPRTSRTCADCGKDAPVKTSAWPIGPVCAGCYNLRLRNPKPCTGCGAVRVLIGTDATGNGLCGPCSGVDLDYLCPRCGKAGNIHTTGSCASCVVGDRVNELLSGTDGYINEQLRPLARVLAGTDRPFEMLTWLARSRSATLLARLARQHTEITHDSLDELAQDRGTRYVRAHLVATGILPARNENLAQLRLWVDTTLTGLPAHHTRLLRPFAEWHVLRDARRRADRGTYTEHAASGDRTDIRAAMLLLQWLDAQNLTLADLEQAHLDTWLSANPTKQRALRSFARWIVARGVTAKLEVPIRKRTEPTQFVDDTELRRQLHRCLTDEKLPIALRVAGTLIRLYAMPVSRIVELTVDQYRREENNAYLTIDRHPVLLPPKLAQLIETLAAQRPRSLIDHPSGSTHYLLPGHIPNHPRQALALTAMLRQYGLPTIAARNTAMIEAVTQLPPIVVSDLFGLNPNTATAWARYAQDSWAAYLAARSLNG